MYSSYALALFNIVNDVIFSVIHSVPMKRLGSIDEVLKSVAYLLSDDSSYSTGTNLVIDGGLSCGLKA